MNVPIIKLKDVYEKIIPSDAQNERNQKYKEKYTEWCCTKYNINENIYVVISISHPESQQIMYINNAGEQIIYNLDNKYDKFIVEKKYWYAND